MRPQAPVFNGSLDSMEWNGGMDWNGGLEWNFDKVDSFNGFSRLYNDHL